MNLLTYINKEIINNLEVFSFEEDFTQKNFTRFTELALFYEYSAEEAEKRDKKGKKKIEEFLFEKMSILTEDDIFNNFYYSYHLILPYISIRKFKKIKHIEDCLDIICEHKFITPEAPPHRAMELDYLLYKLGKISVAPIPENSILKKDYYLQFIDNDLAYAITHILFYATDFGFNNSKIEVDIPKLKFNLECLIAKFYEMNHIDLVAELGINYFSLMQHFGIETKMLQMIDNSFAKTFFIAPEKKEKQFKEKYHTYLVLGIFYSLLHRQLSNHQIPLKEKESLHKEISNTLIFGDEILKTKKSQLQPESTKEFKAWHIVKALKKKEVDIESWTNYTKTYGDNQFLTEEIIKYLQILRKRNKRQILWRREFEHLSLIDNNKKELELQFEAQIEKEIEMFQKC